MKDIVILYHADCPDGFGGAWAAWKKFGDKAEYIAGHYDQPLSKKLKDKEIYMIDFSCSVETMRDLISRNRRVTAIDHHAMREESTKLTHDYSYAIDHSGAVLAWTYFHKNKPMPRLLRYLEERDLFKFNSQETMPIVTYLESFDYDFEVWDRLIADIDNDKKRKDFTEKGALLVKYREELMKRVIEDNARVVIFEGYETYAVNCPYEFADWIGNICYTKKPPIAIMWSEGKDNIHVSLRSDGSVDVSKIARKYSGGGHPRSSAFRLSSIISFPWKEKK